jgi:hypothetical protein
VKWTGVAVRRAGKRDRSLDDEDHAPVLQPFPLAPHDIDPLIPQISREERMAFLQVVCANYLRTAAYTLLLIRVEWEWRGFVSLPSIGVSGRVNPTCWSAIPSAYSVVSGLCAGASCRLGCCVRVAGPLEREGPPG